MVQIPVGVVHLGWDYQGTPSTLARDVFLVVFDRDCAAGCTLELVTVTNCRLCCVGGGAGADQGLALLLGFGRAWIVPDTGPQLVAACVFC